MTIAVGFATIPDALSLDYFGINVNGTTEFGNADWLINHNLFHTTFYDWTVVTMPDGNKAFVFEV